MDDPGKRHDLPGLIGEVNRYGPAIEADLQAVYGLDLVDLIRARRWRRLRVLIDELPEGGRYALALARDEDLAAHLIDTGQTTATRRPALSSHTYVAELMTQLIESVDAQTVILRNAHADKDHQAPMPKRRLRPDTAVDVVRRARSTSAMSDLEDEIAAAKRRHAAKGG